MQSEGTAKNAEGMYLSPWTEVMKKSPRSVSRRGFLRSPNEEFSSTSSDGESSTSRSQSPSSCRPVRWEAPFSLPLAPPPVTKVKRSTEISASCGASERATPHNPSDHESRRNYLDLGGDIVQRRIKSAALDRPSKSRTSQESTPGASGGPALRGASTTDTEPRCASPFAKDGAASKVAISENLAPEECMVQKSHVFPRLDLTSALFEVSDTAGSRKDDDSSTYKHSKLCERAGSRSKSSRSWEHGNSPKTKTKFVDSEEPDFLTSDSGEEATLDTAASDSLLLESLVGWLTANPVSQDGATQGAHEALDSTSHRSPSRSAAPSVPHSRWKHPTITRTSPKDLCHPTVMPKTRREFSGDGYLEATAADFSSPSAPRPRRHSSKQRNGRLSRKSKDVENQGSEWFMSPEDLENAVMSASVESVPGKMLSQSILALFTGSAADP